MFSILKQTEDIVQRYAEAVICGEGYDTGDRVAHSSVKTCL